MIPITCSFPPSLEYKIEPFLDYSLISNVLLIVFELFLLVTFQFVLSTCVFWLYSAKFKGSGRQQSDKIKIFDKFKNKLCLGTLLIAFVMRKVCCFVWFVFFFSFFEAFLLLNSTCGFWSFIRSFPHWVYSRKMDIMIINYICKLWNRKRNIFQWGRTVLTIFQ